MSGSVKASRSFCSAIGPTRRRISFLCCDAMQRDDKKEHGKPQRVIVTSCRFHVEHIQATNNTACAQHHKARLDCVPSFLPSFLPSILLSTIQSSVYVCLFIPSISVFPSWLSWPPSWQPSLLQHHPRRPHHYRLQYRPPCASFSFPC